MAGLRCVGGARRRGAPVGVGVEPFVGEGTRGRIELGARVHRRERLERGDLLLQDVEGGGEPLGAADFVLRGGVFLVHAPSSDGVAPRCVLISEMDLDALRWDEAGLVTVVAQDRATGEVRMVAHANRAAVEETLRTRDAHFFSRSRGKLWRKGEESGNVLRVCEVWRDCDGDALIYLCDPSGPTCHTGTETCFFARLDADGAGRATPALARLWETVSARRTADAEKSYTRALLDAGPTKIAAKVREEGEELARALEAESGDRVVSETSDVVYHAIVGLLARGVTLRDVEVELMRRFSMSGQAEKAARGA